MNLGLSYQDLSEIFNCELPDRSVVIKSIHYDTRKITNGTFTAFFCLKGEFRDGHDFIEQAYVKGVRTFVVDHKPAIDLADAVYIVVNDTLSALQKLAKAQRNKFSKPIIAITGSAGKTIVKEWLAQVLSSTYNVVRSPKSYNSQLGVALSLLELDENADIAIIEAGISQPGEMNLLEEMIKPEYGILTNIGTAHSENFQHKAEHLEEKMVLFKDTQKLIAHDSTGLEENEQTTVVGNHSFIDAIHPIFQDDVSRSNASLVYAMAKELGLESEVIEKQMNGLEPIALRLETYDGINNSMIINDTYSMDLDAFRSSLEYQLTIAGKLKRVVLIDEKSDQEKVEQLLNEYQPLEYHFVNVDDDPIELKNSIILIKGLRSSNMERYAQQYREKKHQTYVEIDLTAVLSNIKYIKSKVPSRTKVLTMVKASSYGSGLKKMGLYLERVGVDYLGVAYADEGIELRQAGVTIPILVMNAEQEGFAGCIEYNLEPAIYSLQHLENFIKECIYQGVENCPIHIKLETGMNRLGFEDKSIYDLINKLRSQPEVKVKSVYSHLATSDDPESEFVHQQAEKFKDMSGKIQQSLSYPVERHLLNSEGSLNYPDYHFDMIRIGIGMYGYSANESHKDKMTEAIKWFSSISQLRKISSGRSVGYGRSQTTDKDTLVAIVPVGYADGFKRSLSQGKGGVYHEYNFCPVIGNVCMDMIMVDVTGLLVKEGDPIEIIGKHQSLEMFANAMGTIPYEVLTSISKRVHRVYIEG